jgi:hypothetical protein
MNEKAAGRKLGPREAQMADEYVSGVDVVAADGGRTRIPALAHDFVIPSVSQVLGPHNGASASVAPGFLGNFVNQRGTHLSGAEEDGEGSDGPLVREVLERMAKRL